MEGTYNKKKEFDHDTIVEWENLGIFKIRPPRKILKVDGYQVPLIVVKSDGGYTYDTTDLVAIRYRLVDLNMDKIIYVVGCAQALHFELLIKAAIKADWKKAEQEIIHVGFGSVLGSDGKPFRSRDGGTIKLIDLLKEAIDNATNIVNTREEKDKEAIRYSAEYKDIVIKHLAYAAIKYADLSTTRTRDYKYDQDKMLSLTGNSACYQLYAYVRICSILRNAQNYIDDVKTIFQILRSKLKKKQNYVKYYYNFQK